MEEVIEEGKFGLPSLGIPAEILFHPKFSHVEMMLFGFIRNLSKSSRGCWASNRWLGELLRVGPQTISNGLKKLEDYRFIKREYKKKKLTDEKERTIFIDNSYHELYKPIVELFHKAYIDNDSFTKKLLEEKVDEIIILCEKHIINNTSITELYTYINELIRVYYEIYNKEDNKKDNEYPLNKNLKDNSASDEALVSFDLNFSHKEDTSLSEKDNPLPEKETGNALSGKGKLLRRSKAQRLRNAPLLVPTMLKLSFTTPKVIQPIIDHWGSCGLKQNKPNTKILKQTIRAIAQLKQGTFFNNKLTFEEYKDYKFTNKEIKKAIDYFAMAATLDDYAPEPGPYKDRLAKMDLITFLHNPFNNSSENKSLFIKHLLHPPKLVSSTAASVKDLDPDVTAMYRNWWENEILDQWLRTNEKITPADESNFRRATAHTLQFMEKYKDKFNTGASGIERLRPGVIAKYVCQAIEVDIREKGNCGFKEITTGWLCTSTTWNKRVLGYFMDQGFIIDHPFSIYDREHKEAVVDTSQYYDPREDYGLYDEEDTRP